MSGPLDLVPVADLPGVAEYAYAATVSGPVRWVHTAGACPLDADGRTVAPGDFAAQAGQAMDNLVVALAASGAGLDDVVRSTVYVASAERSDLVRAWKVVRERFGDHAAPSTLLGVAALGYPDQLVEIDVVAAVAAEHDAPGARLGASAEVPAAGSVDRRAEEREPPGRSSTLPEGAVPVPPSRSGVRVLGVDRWQGAWVGVLLDGDEVTGWQGATIGELVAKVSTPEPPAVVGIDIPIGIADTGLRPADLLARTVVGPRRSSVFAAPVREALAQPGFPEANDVSRRLSGQGLSRQAFALGAAIREVDEWVRGAGTRVVEVHPEVSFATLAGRPLAWSKKTWAGTRSRLELLEQAGIRMPADLGEASTLPVDDVLDAAVAAWSARRVLTGVAVSYPDPPNRFSDGLESAIWA